MQIVIHGTKGGYHRFTLQKISGLIDARPDFNKVAAIGQHAYSINYNGDSDVIFSKYRIIRDVTGEKRTGNIAFSVIFSNREKLSGTDAKNLLDKLANEYGSKYIPEGDNLENVHEDWSFINVLLGQYENRLGHNQASDYENFQQGPGEAAFIYYPTDEKLYEFFDSPYLEEFKPFRQIFFVKSNLEGKPENPLNALRHDPANNLTDMVDIENIPYRLKEFHGSGKNGVTIEIWGNDKKRHNKDIIRKKDTIRIKYSKNKYYKEIKEIGKLLDENIRKYFIIDENKLYVINDVSLDPETQNINFILKDIKGNQIFGVDIECERSYSKERKNVIGNLVIFEAEEMKEIWKVSAHKDNFYGETDFIPEKQNGDVIITLKEIRKVRFCVLDNKDGCIIYDYYLQIKNKRIRPNATEIEFIDDEINKTWSITISHSKYEAESFNYCPDTDENPKYINLRNREVYGNLNQSMSNRIENRFYLKIDEQRGKRSHKGEPIDDYVLNLPAFKCDPKFGYKFLNWEIRTVPYEDYKNYYEAQFKELWWHKIPWLVWILLGVFVLIIAIVIIIISLSSYKSEKDDDLPNNINSYVDGIELNEISLKYYKTKYCTEAILSSPDKEKGLWQIIFPFGSKNEDNTKAQQKPDFCQKIDDAIEIRKAINNGKIDMLSNMQYSENQEKFNNAVNSIDDRFKQKIGQIMFIDTVSKMDLNQIATYIVNLQKLLKIREEVNTMTDKAELENKKTEIYKIAFPVDSIKNNINAEINIRIPTQQEQPKDRFHTQPPQQRPQQPPPQRSKERPQQRSQEPPQQMQQKKQEAGSLRTDFWNLVHSGNDKKQFYDDLLKKYQNKKNLSSEGTDIISYLKSICKNNNSFKKFKDIDEIVRINANTLTEISIY